VDKNNFGLKKLSIFTVVLSYFACCVLGGCTKNPQINGVDWDAWRADRGGCSGHRTAKIDTFLVQKNQLKGVTANYIGELLGRPDQEKLDERNQKYYTYFLESGSHCGNHASATPMRINIRFSAIGLATEVIFERE
jgi:hypothetical protein